MSLLINLTPAEEAQLSIAAMQTGLTPEAFAERLVREHLPTVSPADELTKQLRERQEQDRIKMMPSRTTAELFAQWDAEDAQMTEEEREALAQYYARGERSGN